MTTFFTSDHHFHHKNIIEYCGRPFRTADGGLDVDLMNETLIRNWNARVMPDDEVYVLGDFAFGSIRAIAEVAARLNGKKYLVRGNHDGHTISAYLKAGFERAAKFMWYEDILLVHRPTDAYKYLPATDLPPVVFCGHVHEKWRYTNSITDRHGRQTWAHFHNVGVDVQNLTPVTIGEMTPHVLNPKTMEPR